MKVKISNSKEKVWGEEYEGKNFKNDKLYIEYKK